MSKKPNLLLCFDAFGTLIMPKTPVHKQYQDVAAQTGLKSLRRLKNRNTRVSFKAAFKAESERNPNYGKATGLGATKWWTNVIHNTFKPFLHRGEVMPADLAPRLLSRFASMNAYTLMRPGLVKLLRDLKAIQGEARLYDDIVIGIVTNSDDRVPVILSAAGFKVSPLRYGEEGVSSEAAIEASSGPSQKQQEYDIDFHCMSYDVGVEKPDRAIFEAAETMLEKVLAARDHAETTDTGRTWEKIYVGDEYDKDVVGALAAGWRPVLLKRYDDMVSSNGDKIASLEDAKSQANSIAELFEQHKVIGVRRVDQLPRWLMSGNQQS